METKKITYSDEVILSLDLIELIKKADWVDANTILVNCTPEYSSGLSQLINHKFSYLNKNELFEMIDLEMPYPSMNQVFNKEKYEYQSFDTYLKDWITKNIYSTSKYLFIDTGKNVHKNFSKIKLCLKDKLEPSQFMFSSIFLTEDAKLIPDFYVYKANPLFEWENSKNKNF